MPRPDGWSRFLLHNHLVMPYGMACMHAWHAIHAMQRVITTCLTYSGTEANNGTDPEQLVRAG